MAAGLGCRVARTKSLVRQVETRSARPVVMPPVKIDLPCSDARRLRVETDEVEDVREVAVVTSRDLAIRLKARCYIAPRFEHCIFLVSCYCAAIQATEDAVEASSSD